MTIHQIECFLEAARTLNFTEAAGHLYISQQGLSRQISSLEKELEIRLFERTTREVRLTRAGEILLWKWQNIPGMIQESVRMAREDNERDKDRIHVAVQQMNGLMGVVGRILVAYTDLKPGTEFELREYEDIKELTEGNSPDLTIVVNVALDMEKFHDRFGWTEIHEFPLYYVYSKKNPLAQAGELDSDSLKDQTLLCVFKNNMGITGMKILDFLGDSGYIPSKLRYFENFESLELALNAGEGIHIGYKEFYRDYGDRLSMYPIPNPDFQVIAKVVAIWKTEHEDRLRPLVDYLKGIGGNAGIKT